MSWPTTDKPRVHFVTLRLTDEENDDLLWLQAATSGRDRSDTLRTALARVVKAEKRRASKSRRSGTPGPKLRDEDDTQDGTDS